MNLDIKFIILSLILIAAIVPLYIYREKLISLVYKKGDIKNFLSDIKLHMSQNHPFIPINYSIVEKTKEEKDIRVRETLIVESLIEQFLKFEYDKMTQGTVSKDKLWTGYEEKSKSAEQKPSDWKARRELAWNRDNQRCNRCGQVIKLNEAQIDFVKSIKSGGGYNIENLVVLCGDCNKITNNQNIKPSTLEIQDKLMFYVES